MIESYPNLFPKAIHPTLSRYCWQDRNRLEMKDKNGEQASRKPLKLRLLGLFAGGCISLQFPRNAISPALFWTWNAFDARDDDNVAQNVSPSPFGRGLGWGFFHSDVTLTLTLSQRERGLCYPRGWGVLLWGAGSGRIQSSFIPQYRKHIE